MPELDGVQPLTVEVLSPDDAVRMLLRLARRTSDEVDVDDARRVVELCGWLPLAIAISASQLRGHPSWPVRHLLDQLVRAHDRLDELKAGDRSVRAAFDTSLRDLTADQRELFALLGVHHGPEIDAHAAAALAGSSTNRVCGSSVYSTFGTCCKRRHLAAIDCTTCCVRMRGLSPHS